MKKKVFDIIVVGGGLIGKATALELSKTKLTILCIDPTVKEYGLASTAAGAMLGAFGEITADKKSPLDENELAFRITAQRMYPDWIKMIKEFSKTRLSIGYGTFMIANSAGVSDNKNLEAVADKASKFNMPYEWVDPEVVPNLKPNQHYATYRALFLPEEGYVNTQELLASLDAALSNIKNVTVVNNSVKKVLIKWNKAEGVETVDGKEFFAEHVVVCAGIGTQNILQSSGVKAGKIPKIMAGKGVSLVLQGSQKFEHVIRTPNRDYACGIHAVPRGGESVYIGATNRLYSHGIEEDGIMPGELHYVLQSAMYEINTDFRTFFLKSMAFGSRPVTVDRYPLVGKTHIQGLSLGTGTYRNGVLMTPLVAKLVAEDVLGVTSSYDNPFRPIDRVSMNEDYSTAITEGARDFVNFIQEPGGFLPYNRQEELEQFIKILANMAFAEGNEYQSLRKVGKEMLKEHPISEIFPLIYYLYADAAKEIKK